MQQRSKSGAGKNPVSQIWEHLNVVALKKTYYQSRTSSAVCVQHSIDSRNSAIHSAYRTLLRPSSLPEPRDPSLKIVKTECLYNRKRFQIVVDRLSGGSCVTHWRELQPPLSQFTGVSTSCMNSRWSSGVKLDYLSRKWSFRRFTYGNLVTTSPSSKW